MVVTNAELRRALQSVRARAVRARSNLNRLAKISTNRPSLKTVRTGLDNLQDSLRHIKRIAHTLGAIVGR